MILYHIFHSSLASTCAFEITFRWYIANSGLSASANATALAAMRFSCGQPCIPGKTARAIAGP
jgi:hypothetical protein